MDCRGVSSEWLNEVYTESVTVPQKPTDELLKLSIYYNFNWRFCNIGAGHEKGNGKYMIM